MEINVFAANAPAGIFRASRPSAEEMLPPASPISCLQDSVEGALSSYRSFGRRNISNVLLAARESEQHN